MRRFILTAVAGLSVCLGGATFAQAKEVLVKSVTTKTVVTKTVVEKEVVAPHVAVRVVPERDRHVEVAHWGRGFEVVRHHVG
jgi:hypothetical protein